MNIFYLLIFCVDVNACSRKTKVRYFECFVLVNKNISSCQVPVNVEKLTNEIIFLKILYQNSLSLKSNYLSN